MELTATSLAGVVPHTNNANRTSHAASFSCQFVLISNQEALNHVSTFGNYGRCSLKGILHVLLIVLTCLLQKYQLNQVNKNIVIFAFRFCSGNYNLVVLFAMPCFAYWKRFN